MIFGPELLPKVLDGTKTMTRRLRSHLQLGGVYAIQRGLGKNGTALAEARIRIIDKYVERLEELTLADAHREGFKSRDAFFAYWRTLYSSVPMKQVVIVLKFKRVWTCLGCGCEIGARGLCGECACEDDCAGE